MSEQKYPYFTVTHVTSGQLVKLTNKKFNSFYEASHFISEKYKNKEDIFNSQQTVILEYKSPYESIIYSIHSFGLFYFI